MKHLKRFLYISIHGRGLESNFFSQRSEVKAKWNYILFALFAGADTNGGPGAPSYLHKKNLSLALVEFFQRGGQKIVTRFAREFTKTQIILEGGPDPGVTNFSRVSRANLPNTDLLPPPRKNPVSAPAYLPIYSIQQFNAFAKSSSFLPFTDAFCIYCKKKCITPASENVKLCISCWLIKIEFINLNVHFSDDSRDRGFFFPL